MNDVTPVVDWRRCGIADNYGNCSEQFFFLSLSLCSLEQYPHPVVCWAR